MSETTGTKVITAQTPYNDLINGIHRQSPVIVADAIATIIHDHYDKEEYDDTDDFIGFVIMELENHSS